MLKIERFVTMSPEQWDIVIEGMRNPKNSWDRSDSYMTYIEDPYTLETAEFEFFLGENDEALMESLVKGGPVHAKFRRMMPVWVTITAPLYWWKEFDTYKVGTVSNSCSTMHKIHAKEFTLEDFSTENLFELGKNCSFADLPVYNTEYWHAKLIFQMIIKSLNHYRQKFLEAKTKPMKDESKRAENVRAYWDQMIQLLPTSYNQKRTIKLNYEVLHNIWHSRRNHKLDEWHVLCDWIEELPYSELITGKFSEPENP